MIKHALDILPVALALVLPVVILGIALLYWVRCGSLTTTMTVLVLVPIIAMLTGVLGVSGFMFNTTLATISLVCLLVLLVACRCLVVVSATGRLLSWPHS